MSKYDRQFPTYLDIALTEEDRRIWDRMPYLACNNYMQGHTMDTGISQCTTIQKVWPCMYWIVTPMQHSRAARIRINSAERLGVFDDRYAIY